MIEISVEDFRHIISRLLDNARDATEELRKDKSNLFMEGVCQGYYEALDTLQSELYVADVDLNKIGFDVDLLNDI